MLSGRPLILVRLAAMVTVAALATSGCGDGEDGGGGSGSPSTAPSSTPTTGGTPAPVPITVVAGGEVIMVRPLVEGVAAVCRAATEARAGGDGQDQSGIGAQSLATARATFFDHAHEPMHELARAVGESDRAAAARLLEAKQAVESGLTDNASPLGLAADLSQLFDAAAAALGRLAIPAPPCQK